MLGRMRKTGHFYVFSPVHDLSAIARGDAGELSAFSDSAKGRFVDVQRSGGEVIGDEWASQIVRSRGGIVLRAGLLLKSVRCCFIIGPIVAKNALTVRNRTNGESPQKVTNLLLKVRRTLDEYRTLRYTACPNQPRMVNVSCHSFLYRPPS